MGDQNAMLYSFVARGGVILAEHTTTSKKSVPAGNFKAIAEQSLRNLPAVNGKSLFSHDGLVFNFLVDNGFSFSVVSDKSLGRQTPIAFLERVKDDFMRRYGNGKIESTSAHSLDKDYGPKLKEHMQYCLDHPDEVNKLSKVKAQVMEVKGIMMENIEKVLERGEKIDLLVDKSESLRYQVHMLFTLLMFNHWPIIFKGKAGSCGAECGYRT